MTTAEKAGWIISVGGFSATVIQSILAAIGSPLAPSWLHSYVAVFVTIAGMIITLLATVRSTTKSVKDVRVVWIRQSSIPPELDPLRRRSLRRKLPFTAWLLPLLMLILMLTAVLMITYPETRRWGALQARGVETEGHISKLSAVGGSSEHFYVDYAFVAGTSEESGSAAIAKHRWEKLHANDKLRVTYLPAASFISLPFPHDSLTWRLRFETIDSQAIVMAALITTMPAIAIFLFAVKRKQDQLVLHGVAAIATVTDAGATLKYEFQAGSEIVTGKCLYRSVAMPKPETGDPFVVLYDPERPSRNIPWYTIESWFRDPHAITAIPGAARTQPPLLPAIDQTSGRARIRITWQAPLVLFIISAWVLLGVASLSTANRHSRLIKQLRTSGLETRGTVLSTRATNSKEGVYTYVEYSFQANGKPRSGSYRVSGYTLRERYVGGQPTPVTYLPNDPDRSAPFAKSDLDKPAVMERGGLMKGWFMLLAGAMLSVLVIWQTLDEYRFARHGRRGAARVLETPGTLFRKCRIRYMTSAGEIDELVRIRSKTFRPSVDSDIEILFDEQRRRSRPVEDMVWIRRA